ncbi:hypothetical protein, partial [Aliivibrio finisterrensis]|uniref:hypothetical protein n=1 Tax=Aliivibrio finisterrensis TaxID=511998 RepID=UPI00142EC09D
LVDAINALDDYADGSTTTAPDLATYHTVGFDELNSTELEWVNQILATDNTLLSLDAIQNVISAVNRLTDYSLGTSTIAPTISDYNDTAFTGVGVSTLDFINSKLWQFGGGEYLPNSFIKASNATNEDYFGRRVELSDDGLTMVVAAAYDNATTSKLYVYRRINGNWQEVTILQDGSLAADYTYGVALSADGRRVVTASYDMIKTYEVDVSSDQPDWFNWSLVGTQAHTISDKLLSANLSGDGNTLVLGEYRYGSFDGRIVIYQYNGSGWTERNQFIGTGRMGGINKVALSYDGKTIVAGEPKDSHIDVFTRDASGSNWILTQSNLNAGRGGNEGFSVSLNSDGTRLAAGSRTAVDIYDYDGSQWNYIQTLLSNNALFDAFGSGVNLSGDGDELVVASWLAPNLYKYDLSDLNAANWETTVITYDLEFDSSYGTSRLVESGLDFKNNTIVLGNPYNSTNLQSIVANNSGNDGSDGLPIFGSGDISSDGSIASDFVTGDVSLTNSGAVYVLSSSGLSSDRVQAAIDGSNVVLAWAAGGSTEPTVTDYLNASIDNVTVDNLSDINSQLQSLAHTEMVNVQPMVDSINVIQAYAVDNTQTAPSLTDYVAAGISGVSATNLSDVNGQVDTHSLTQMASVQTMVDSFNIIQSYAADNTQTAPTVTNYADIGVIGVDTNNLSEINEQADSQSLTSVAGIQTVVDSLVVIQSYAADNTQTTPTVTSYADIGVTGVDANSLSEVNGQVDSQSLTTVAAIQALTDSVNVIQSYAADNTQPAPSVSDYADFGVTGVDANNLAEINWQVDSQSLTTVASIQTVVDSLAIIQSYAADNTQTAPTVTNYADIGVTGVDANNLSEVNSQVDGQSLTTVAAIQTLTNSVNVIQNYAADNTQPAPSATDYAMVGVTGVDANSLSEVNGQVDSQSLTTVAAIQALTNSVNVIQSYALDNTQSAPSATHYAMVGISGVDANNLNAVNGQVDSQSLTTVAEIQALTDSVNVIQSYALDNTQPAPSVSDYADFGVTGIDANNLAEINAQVDSQSLTSVASIQTLIDSLTVVQNYAVDNTQTVPTVTDYALVGVTGVTVNNLSEVNGQVDSQSLTTVAAIQILTDSVNVIQSYALDNTQPAPSATDYAMVGVTGV